MTPEVPPVLTCSFCQRGDPCPGARLAQLRESGPTGELVADRIELTALAAAVASPEVPPAPPSSPLDGCDACRLMDDRLDHTCRGA